jgi:transposase
MCLTRRDMPLGSTALHWDSFVTTHDFKKKFSNIESPETSRPNEAYLESSRQNVHFSSMKAISASTRNRIQAMLGQGLSVRCICHRVGVSSSTVGRVRKTCSTNLPSSRGGRPSKLSPSLRRFCVNWMTTGKAKSAKNVQKRLLEDQNVAVSRMTIGRTLHSAGLGAFEKVSKPLLSKKNIKERLDFAKQHKDWTVNDWRRVIWSDESKINRFNSDGRQWCWIRSPSTLQEAQVKGTVKHGGGSVMVWGCITSMGPGYLCKVQGNMDQSLYKQILEDELVNTMQWYQMSPSSVIFQHDNDPKHSASSIKAYLSQQQYQVLPWPAQSPDLNPIEHIWALVKRRLNEYSTPPEGINELWERVNDIWDGITKEECLKVVESMPRRLQAVLKAKGKWTNY